MFRHRFDPSSLVAGILFLGFALRYLKEGFGGRPVAFVWAIPVGLATIAIIVLVRLMFHSRRSRP